MKMINFTANVKVLPDDKELSAEDRNLVLKARESAKQAYSPYSHFKVGAAILLGQDTIITGNNQENAAYPSGLCAERTAAFYASSQYPDLPFRKIAVCSIHPAQKGKTPVSPCGACRQALLEYEHKFKKSIEVILVAEEGEIYIFDSVASLLPYSFTSDELKIANP